MCSSLRTRIAAMSANFVEELRETIAGLPGDSEILPGSLPTCASRATGRIDARPRGGQFPSARPGDPPRQPRPPPPPGSATPRSRLPVGRSTRPRAHTSPNDACWLGLELGAVDAHQAHAQQLQLLGQKQNLQEALRHRVEVLPPEARDRIVVGVPVRRNEANPDIAVRRPLDTTAGKDPVGVAVDQRASIIRG